MNKKQYAYTLVEVLMTCVIFTLILESIYTTLTVSQRAWKYYSEDVLLKQNVRGAIIGMSNELREAENIFIIKNENSNSLTLNFVRPLSVGPVAYNWSDTGDNAYKIIRTNYSHSRILASNITYLSLTQPADNVITIEVAAGTNKKYDLREEIALRGKTGLIAP